jgi:hypothetical protein
MKLPSDFRDLLEEFVREGVEHVVIVGTRSLHVEPRQLERARARRAR